MACRRRRVRRPGTRCEKHERQRQRKIRGHARVMRNAGQVNLQRRAGGKAGTAAHHEHPGFNRRLLAARRLRRSHAHVADLLHDEHD